MASILEVVVLYFQLWRIAIAWFQLTLWFKARGLRDMCIRHLFFKFFWKIMKEKDWSDPQPDFANQPKAQGLLHMEHEYFAHHIWSRFRGLNTSQPRSNRKYLEDYSTYLKEGLEATGMMFWLLEVLKDARPSTRRLQDSATKISGAYQTRGGGTAYRHRMF